MALCIRTLIYCQIAMAIFSMLHIRPTGWSIIVIAMIDAVFGQSSAWRWDPMPGNVRDRIVFTKL